MTRLGTRSGVVVEADEESQTATVRFDGMPGPHLVEFATLYDATGLLVWADALELFRNGGAVDYVIPGGPTLRVSDMFLQNSEHIAVVGDVRLHVKVNERAPRFLEVVDASR
jgi:hypothetical protein